MSQTVIDKDPQNWVYPGYQQVYPFMDVFKDPDNEEFVKKAGRMLRFTGVTTAIFSTIDCILFTEPKHFLAAASRVWYWGVPLIGGGLAYNMTVTTLAGIRGKSDHTNHFFAGCATGAVTGAARRNMFLGVVLGGFLGLCGIAFKDASLKGYKIIPDTDPLRSKRGNAFSHKMDFDTWFAGPDRQGYWARSEEEAKKLMESTDFDYRECVMWKK